MSGGMGNVDPRVQQNPSVASPLGGSINSPMTQDIMSPSSFPPPESTTVVPPESTTVPHPEMTTVMPPMYGRPMQQPYGQPQPQPYQVFPGPMPTPMPSRHGGIAPHSHGESGEIIQEPLQKLGLEVTPRPDGGHSGGRPYRGPMPDLQDTGLGSLVPFQHRFKF